MSSPYADLDRPPLRRSTLERACERPWTALELYDEIDSTNRVAADAARSGRASGLVVVAELQTAGRGRLDRHWISPPRAGLTLSMMLRPTAPTAQWPSLLALVATAATTVLRRSAEIDVQIKWPNDLVVDGRKLGGLLAEIVDDAVVLGIGINVTTRRAELPGPAATSLGLEGAQAPDRLPLLLALLRQVGSDFREWSAADGAPVSLRTAYHDACTTIGRRVRAELPDGTVVEGEAVDVDDIGHLVIDDAGTHRVIAAADIVHLRAAD